MENDALSTVTGPARPCESHRTRLSRWTSRPATLSPRHLLGRWSRRGGSTMILESGIRARSNSRQSPGARQTQNVLSAASEFRNCTKQSRQQLIDDGDGHRRYVTSDGEETVRDHRGRELLTSRASARRTGRPLSRGLAPSDRVRSSVSKQSSHRRPKTRSIPICRWSSRPTRDTNAFQPQRWHTPKRCLRSRRPAAGLLIEVEGWRCPATPPGTPMEPTSCTATLSAAV